MENEKRKMEKLKKKKNEFVKQIAIYGNSSFPTFRLSVSFADFFYLL